MDAGALQELAVAHFLPLFLMLAWLCLGWLVYVWVVTGRSNGRGGVAYHSEQPVLYWMNLAIPAMFMTMALWLLGDIILSEISLPRFLLICTLLALCVWQGLPYLRAHFWGKMPGDYTKTYFREDLERGMEAHGFTVGARGAGIPVLYPWGSLFLTALFLFAVFRAARYLG